MESSYSADQPSGGALSGEVGSPSPPFAAFLTVVFLGSLLLVPLVALPVTWFGTFGTLMIRSGLIERRADKVVRIIIGSLFLSLGVSYTLFFAIFH